MIPRTGISVTYPGLTGLESYSVLWRGRLIVPQSGTYPLYLNSDDASYLFCGEGNAQLLVTSNATINNGSARPAAEQSASGRLEAGRPPAEEL